ncbi:MAG: gliding motility-associated C-terminal domain-containing protein [Bacteroidetes bacterium]|nr:gliding motility-associated C-terminal domain-containing protein [Bacteroidota bacterium]
MKKIFFSIFVFLLFAPSLRAQQGKDGTPSITSSTVVNVYTALVDSITAGTNTLTVSSTTGLSTGDLLLILQMQGAVVKANVYQWGNRGNALPNDTSFGKVTNYQGTGNNEFAEVVSISGNTITVACNLKNNYWTDLSKNLENGYWRKTQVIRVPRYVALTLSGSGQITCPAWNGTTGGVAAVEVQGNTVINNAGVNVSGMGFRGGSVLNAAGYSATNTGGSFISSPNNLGAHKGESIVGDTNLYTLENWYANYSFNTPLALCKGNVANGGGGGDAMNAGGGGGSNGGVISLWNGMGNPDMSSANNIAAWNQEPVGPVGGTSRPTSSSGGGRGGYAFSANNVNPTTNGPSAPGTGPWGGDYRHNDGGWGGIPLDYSTGKIFLGGGGGAGDSNDGSGTSGANGGGIFYLISYGTVSGAGQIIADGLAASNTTGGAGAGADGAGGGGGGGAVIINSLGSINLTNATAISAQGGKGGNYVSYTFFTNNNFGPGGGGGGGYVSLSNSITGGVNVNGGANGIAVAGGGNNTQITSKFPPNGATAGGAGSNNTFISKLYNVAASNYTTCPSSSATFSATVSGNPPSGLSVMWYTAATSGSPVYTGNPYNFTAPSVAGTYTYYAGACPGTNRVPVILTVSPGATPTVSITATSTNVCVGTPVTLSVSGTAVTYTWSSNAGGGNASTATVTPLGNTTYSIAANGGSGCGAGTATASIAINTTTAPSLTITASSYSICSGNSSTLTASGSSSYTWSANAASATSSSVAVSPISNTTYTVTGGTGTCTSSKTVSISVTPTPTVSISPGNAYICNGASGSFTASGASTYSWNSGATTSTVSVSPASNTVYTVTGYNASCAGTQTVLVKVDAGISTTNYSVTNATCGQANGSYILNSISGGISPYQINFNGTGFNAISAFSYTVSSLNGNNYPIALKDSLGCVYSTSVIIGNTSGISAMDTVITKAKCNPAASGAIAINSITGGVAPYQTNINGGSFSTISTFPYTYSNLTAGVYTVSVKDASNCPLSYIVNVQTTTGVTAVSYTANSDTCSRNVGAIQNIVPTGGTPSYSFSINGGAYQTANMFNGLAGGTYTLSVQDANGCLYTAPTVSLSNTGTAITPTVTASGSTTFCQGGSVILTCSSASTYTWSTGANTASITVSSGGSYSVSATSSNGCSANSSVVTVTVNPLPPTPVVNDTIISECSNQIQTLIFGHASGTLIIHNASNQIQAIPFTPTVSGVYTAYDSLSTGCISAVKTITVSINPAPTGAPLVVSPTNYCLGSLPTALSATASTGATLIWQDANHNTISTPTPATGSLGVQTYYVYQAIGACVGTNFATVTVYILPKPTASFTFSPNSNLSIGQPITFAPSSTYSVDSYFWNFEDPNVSSSVSTNSNPTYIYNTAGTYCPKMVITNTVSGCKDSTTNCLDVLANISMIIPNVFSPNGDGINDVFSVKATGYNLFTCDIYDRWGLRLFTFNSTSGYWDGGKSVDGTYFYTIKATDAKGQDHAFNGFMELIR